MVGAYDAVIGRSLYNRLVWGTWSSRYAQAARRALALADAAPLLDCGCGTLCFTANAYRQAPLERLVLLDRSVGMLRRGRRRLPQGRFLQGDALDPPFVDQVFGTTMAWGMVHLFGSASPLLDQLRRVTRSGGQVFITVLVRSRRLPANRMLQSLHARGESAAPETATTVRDAFASHFDLVDSQQWGAMLFLHGRVTG
jgi:ubiquinone/menaquinone biosynthesis C-methylase UbiE